MIAPDWIPEKYPPSGTIGAAGFYKLLGRPQLDPLTVLVRETAQNSWDAKRPRSRSVKFEMAGKDLSREERAFLVRLLSQRELANGTGLDALPDDCAALYVTDRGTIGLGGPLSASAVSDDNVYDWVDFVLNVGKANTQGHSGGTYGFGKTIAYVVSAVNTVVVYSRAKHRDGLQTRLIACAIGSEFKHENALFTGRHWWGRNIGGTPAPLLDEEADLLAANLGMPAFIGKETGTTLMIVHPDFGERTPAQGMRFLAEAALWNLWPKLVSREDGPPEMNVAFSWNSKRVPLPSPESRPPLGGFVQAFQEMLVDRAEVERPVGFRLDDIRLERPKKIVGRLATVPLVYRERSLVDDGPARENSDSPAGAAMISGPAHHVALLRSPNLVVEYLEGPPAPEANFEWVGVFKASHQEDHIFAMAEPPTHDSWRPDLIPDRTGKSTVKMALQNIRKVLDERWGRRADGPDSPSASTSHVAHRLAHLVAGVVGTGALPTDRPTGGTHSRRQPRLQVVSSGPVHSDDELALTHISFVISPVAGARETDLYVSIGIALSGGGVDLTADPGLRLHSIDLGGVTSELAGMSARLHVVGDQPVLAKLLAVRTTDLSVSFELQVSEAGA